MVVDARGVGVVDAVRAGGGSNAHAGRDGGRVVDGALGHAAGAPNVGLSRTSRRAALPAKRVAA
ncbi:MAG TPA: hypothetical protein VF453_07200, partial [Burkholderiaceae bacterium]